MSDRIIGGRTRPSSGKLGVRVVPTKTKKRPARRRGAALALHRREEILTVAARVFAERGYPGTDVQVVADAVPVGKGTIYRYFPTKEALFLAAVDRAMHRLSGAIQSAVDEQADPIEQIAAAVRAYLAFFDAHPDCTELLIMERAAFKDRKKPTYFEHRDSNLGRWIELFRGLIANGRVRSAPVEEFTETISDLLYGTIFTNHFAGRQEPLEEQAGRILRGFFLGILSDSERRQHAAAGKSLGK